MTTNYTLITLRDHIPDIVAELNELADGNYNLGAMREALPSECATLLVGLTTELNVQLAMARRREAELVAALRKIATACADSPNNAPKALAIARAALAGVTP